MRCCIFTKLPAELSVGTREYLEPVAPEIAVIFPLNSLPLMASALGNGLNFALNLLSCYVHDLRLQCLEYFGKFYKDGGRPFKPLAINTKYVDIQS